jgi:ATP-dependent Lon protease
MYRNLFGAVERMVDRSGKLVTNFTRITAGSLLQAHGGCVIVNLIDVLSEPLVWRALKRALKTGTVEIEAYDPFAMFATAALKPEPMTVDTRVVLTGPTEIFQLLYFLDEEFREIFKVRVDFGFEAEGAEARRTFITQVARIVKEEKLPPLAAGAVARLMEVAARSVGDRRKLPSQWGELGDTIREAAFWAGKEARATIEANDVQRAVEQRRFRLNRVEEKIRELIRDKVILVDVDGAKVGQVNGLAVLDIGGYNFGRPSRITAVASMGTHGVVAVDREAGMSGKTYDKAVLIVSGYLRQQYAQKFPMSLSASLSFEQSYSGIDGDSASAAELLALISRLSDVPLRQDLAVTGSSNQFGEIQPIGGVNEKIEGFFYTCREIGLTGKQGVVIPAQNTDNLILDREVTAAVRDGRFHIYPIRTIDEGLQLFTGVKAGSVDEEGTIHHRAAAYLKQLAQRQRQFGRAPKRADERRKEEKKAADKDGGAALG